MVILTTSRLKTVYYLIKLSHVLPEDIPTFNYVDCNMIVPASYEQQILPDKMRIYISM